MNPASSPSPSLQTHDSVSVHVDLILPCRPLTVAYFSIWLVLLLAVSIDCFCNVEQSTLRPPDVRIVYRKIGIYMVHMGDNNMHGARTGKNEVTNIARLNSS